MTTQKKKILIIYHSQGGTMEIMASRFLQGAEKAENISIVFKKAAEATLEDLLACDGIGIGSPEYFGTMAGMIKDFFDRTYEAARDETIGLPFVLFVCAGNDGRGALTQIERITTAYKWRKAQEYIRVVSPPTEEDLLAVEELGHALALGVEIGIF